MRTLVPRPTGYFTMHTRSLACSPTQMLTDLGQQDDAYLLTFTRVANFCDLSTHPSATPAYQSDSISPSAVPKQPDNSTPTRLENAAEIQDSKRCLPPDKMDTPQGGKSPGSCVHRPASSHTHPCSRTRCCHSAASSWPCHRSRRHLPAGGRGGTGQGDRVADMRDCTCREQACR